LGLKAQRCPKCQKWGSFLATSKIDGKDIKWAVISYYHDFQTGKDFILDESTNTNNKIKKKIYGKDLKPKELELLRPFHGINNIKNHGISSESVVDDSCQPANLKWSEDFQKKYWGILNET